MYIRIFAIWKYYMAITISDTLITYSKTNFQGNAINDMCF